MSLNCHKDRAAGTISVPCAALLRSWLEPCRAERGLRCAATDPDGARDLGRPADVPGRRVEKRSAELEKRLQELLDLVGIGYLVDRWSGTERISQGPSDRGGSSLGAKHGGKTVQDFAFTFN